MKSPNKQAHAHISPLRDKFTERILYFSTDFCLLCGLDLVVSLLPATRRQYFILVLSLPLRWLRVTFVLNTLIALNKRAIFQPSDIPKRLSIEVFVILLRYR